jgi:hypothetical protein
MALYSLEHLGYICLNFISKRGVKIVSDYIKIVPELLSAYHTLSKDE